MRQEFRQFAVCFTFFCFTFCWLQRSVAAEPSPKPTKFIGRWDLVVLGTKGSFPSWLETSKSGHATLVGRYVGQFGSARPIGKIESLGDTFRFSVPPLALRAI